LIPARIVFVHRRHPEDRHDRITDELLDNAAMGLDDIAHRVEVTRHHRPHRLRIHLLTEGRR
jgi:hypothetical protein